MQQDSTTTGLDAAFEEWVRALNNMDVEGFAAFFADDSEILDEDFPWRMSKTQFFDHLGFHMKPPGLWESFEYVTRETNAKVWGTTGHVSGYSTLRGKPRDAASASASWASRPPGSTPMAHGDWSAGTRAR